MPPLSFEWRKIFCIVVIGHSSFALAQSDYLLENPLGVGGTLGALPFPPLDGFNKNFLLAADADTTLPPGELQHPSEVYSPNGQVKESPLMQISNTNTNDGCQALGRSTIDMLPSYTKKLLKRQGKFCPASFINISPGAGSEAEQQQAAPVDATHDRTAAVGATFGQGKKPSQGGKKPKDDKKKGPSSNESRKFAPPEIQPEKKKCGNFEFDVFLVCGPLIAASPSLLDSLSVLLAGANQCKCAASFIFRSISSVSTYFRGMGDDFVT